MLSGRLQGSILKIRRPWSSESKAFLTSKKTLHCGVPLSILSRMWWVADNKAEVEQKGKKPYCELERKFVENK